MRHFLADLAVFAQGMLIAACLLIVCLWLIGCTPTPYSAVTRYAAPAGTGSTCTNQGTPCTLQTALSQAQAGDTILLKDGRYTGTSGMLAPPGNKAGSASARITVAAEHDGAVLIDGQNARRPISLTGGNHYWTIRGVNGCCGASVTLQVGQSANYNRIERVILWDTADPAASVVNIWGSTGTVLVDSAAWGHGRKALGRVNDTDSVVLRGLWLKYKMTETYGNNVTASWAYKSRNGKYLNNIVAIDLAPDSTGSHVVVEGPDHYQDWSSSTPVVLEMRGNIAYHVDGQAIGDSVVLSRRSLNPGNVDAGLHVTTVSRNNLTMRRNQPLPKTGHDCPKDGVKVFCDEGQWTDSVGSLEDGTHTTEGGTIPASAAPDLLGLKATAQPAHGAWVKHCYDEEGRIDTGCALWPWPMADRIRDALHQSGYATRGLDGKGETDVTALLLRLAGSTLPTPPEPEPGPTPPGKAVLSCVGKVQPRGALAFTCVQPEAEMQRRPTP